MYKIIVQDKNNPDVVRTYDATKKEHDFFMRVFSNSHYNVTVKEYYIDVPE